MILGMVSHQISKITIFGHKHFKSSSILIFLTENFQQYFILVHIWNQIAKVG